MDALLSSIAEAGWLFSNCYQVDAGLWRVNLRREDASGDWCTDWAEAPTLAEALTECIGKLHLAEFFETQATTHTIDRSKPDLLSSLGLRRTPEPLARRV